MLNPSQIAGVRADIAKRRAAIDAEEADLDAAERVWARYNGIAVATPRPGRKRSADGIPPAFSDVLTVIDRHNGLAMRADVRSEAEALRGGAFTDNAWATLLSKMRTRQLIETDGNMVRRVRENEGGADVS